MYCDFDSEAWSAYTSGCHSQSNWNEKIMIPYIKKLSTGIYKMLVAQNFKGDSTWEIQQYRSDLNNWTTHVQKIKYYVSNFISLSRHKNFNRYQIELLYTSQDKIIREPLFKYFVGVLLYLLQMCSMGLCVWIIINI